MPGHNREQSHFIEIVVKGECKILTCEVLINRIAAAWRGDADEACEPSLNPGLHIDVAGIEWVREPGVGVGGMLAEFQRIDLMPERIYFGPVAVLCDGKRYFGTRTGSRNRRMWLVIYWRRTLSGHGPNCSGRVRPVGLYWPGCTARIIPGRRTTTLPLLRLRAATVVL